MDRETARRGVVAFAGLLGIVCALGPAASAGFKFPKDDANPAFDGYPLGDGSNKQANLDKIQKTKDKLAEKINADLVAQGQPPLAGDALKQAAEAKFDAIRCNVAKAVELAGAQIGKDFGEAKAKCGKDLLDKGSICIDFGSGAQGAQFCDASADCVDDKINIDVDKFGCAKLACYDPVLWDATMTLYEEISHSLQDFTAAADPDADKANAKRQQKAACNEKDVDDKTIPINQALIDGLNNIGNGQPHGQTQPVAKKVLDEIEKLPAGQAKTDAIDKLKKEAEKQKAFDEDTRACYQAAKDALGEFLAGTIDKATLNERLGKIKWQIAGQTAPIEQPALGTFYSGEATSGVVTQGQAGQTFLLATGLAGVYDLELILGGDVLLISGTNALGLGSVLRVADLDGDQIFQAADLQTVVPPTPQLRYTLDLFQPTSGGPAYVYDGLSRLVRPLVDVTFDGIPDQLGGPLNGTMPGLEWVRHFKRTDDGRLLGFETLAIDGNYHPGQPIYELVDAGGDGFYEQLVTHTTFGDVGFAPAPRLTPISGATALEVGAMPGSALVVWTLDSLGQLAAPIGSGSVPANDHVLTLALSQPLQGGEFVVVEDQTHQLLSNPIGARGAVLNELLYDAAGTDDGQTFVELAGPPGAAIGNWSIVSVEGSGASCGLANAGFTIVLPPSAAIGPDGLYVIADTAGGVTSVVIPPAHNGGQPDFLAPNADFENGSDAVQLKNAAGSLVDALGYGPLSCTSEPAGTAIVEGTSAFDAFAPASLARCPAAADSDDNALDFTPDFTPTPGADGEPLALFFAGSSVISGSAGGSVGLQLFSCKAPATQYVILASATTPSGSDPLGVPVDPVTNLFLSLAVVPNPLVVGFVGTVDDAGDATGTLNVPPGTNIPFPLTLYFAALTPIAPGKATNAVAIQLVP